MTKLNEIYKCKKCGSIVLISHKSSNTPSCCGEEMTLINSDNKEGAGEKHIPIVDKIDNGYYLIKISSVEHPMTEEHYIEWVEIITENNKVFRQYLSPNSKPECIFHINETKFIVRSYCNLHGLWETKIGV